MKKELTIFILITIIGFIGFILNLKYCKDPNYITKIDTVYITKIKKNLIPVAVAYPVDSLVNNIIYDTDTVIQIDSVIKYITKYLAKNTFKDTILNDSNGLIIFALPDGKEPFSRTRKIIF